MIRTLAEIQTLGISQIIRKALTGLSIPQEYCCIEEAGFPNPMKVILNTGAYKFDVSSSHLFLGYSPLVIGIYLQADTALNLKMLTATEIHLDFIAEKIINN